MDKLNNSKESELEMLGFELGHIGINTENSDEAYAVANIFENLFGFKKRDTEGAVFADPYVEVLKSPFLGKMGHICIKTNSITKAVDYLKNKGIEFNEKTASYDEDGNLRLIYFKNEIGGFAVHLTQKK